jgi:hypothetical protein
MTTHRKTALFAAICCTLTLTSVALANPIEPKFEQHVLAVGGLDRTSFLSSYIYLLRFGDSRFLAPGLDVSAYQDTSLNPHLELSKVRLQSTVFRFGSGLDLRSNTAYLTVGIDGKLPF